MNQNIRCMKMLPPENLRDLMRSRFQEELIKIDLDFGTTAQQQIIGNVSNVFIATLKDLLVME